MSKGVDYSKWDNIDLSDDEEGMHPNIDKSLMIRIRREQRARRMQEEEEQRKKLLQENTPDAKRKLEELEKHRKWSVDDICHVVSERTIINRRPEEEAKQKEQEKQQEEKMTEDEKAEHKLEKMFENEDLLKEYCKLRDLRDSEEWLIQNSKVLNEESAGWILLHLLDLEMDGKSLEMEHATRQYLMLRNILDLAIPTKSPPGSVIKPFFLQIQQKEKTAELEKESVLFAEKIKLRAIEKRKEMQAAEAAEGAEGDAVGQSAVPGPSSADLD
eukprot:RCo018300